MKVLNKYFLFTAIVTLTAQPPAHAALMGPTHALRSQIIHMALDKPVLAPIAFTRFCLHNDNECRPRHNNIFRPRAIVLDAQKRGELAEVNRQVNNAIEPRAYTKPNFYDSWMIAPHYGDCNDFAVTKRHELLARGWPSRALLLAEVKTTWAEHHLVLIVRTAQGDFVLDNLTQAIRPWRSAPYEWVRVQSPANPNYWLSVSA